MTIKIISDGTVAGTKVVNAETGEMISNITKITWQANSLVDLCGASLELVDVPVEITTPILEK